MSKYERLISTDSWQWIKSSLLLSNSVFIARDSIQNNSRNYNLSVAWLCYSCWRVFNCDKASSYFLITFAMITFYIGNMKILILLLCIAFSRAKIEKERVGPGYDCPYCQPEQVHISFGGKWFNFTFIMKQSNE